MLKEIGKAVEIFHQIGLSTKHGKVPEKKLAAFISILTELLTARYEKKWYPEDPVRGSGYRCIRVNTQCIDPTIIETLKRSEMAVPKDLLRTELTIWVDPGVVSFRIGEDGSIGHEIVDEEAYKLSLKAKRKGDKRSGSESDEGFSSSRSSSPTSSISERSGSVSPPVSRSPVPSKPASSPSPPVMEYNPYSPPARVSYPHHYRSTTPLPPQQPPKSMSPATSQFSSPVRSQPQPVMLHKPPTVMLSNPQGDVFGQAHIPTSASQRSSYTRPRTLFLSQENNGSDSRDVYEAFGKMAFNPYAMPMNYGGNPPHANFYDIPAMA